MKKTRLNSCLVEEDEEAQTPMVTQLSTANNKPHLDNDGGTIYAEHVEDEDAGAEAPGVGMGRQAPLCGLHELKCQRSKNKLQYRYVFLVHISCQFH